MSFPSFHAGAALLLAVATGKLAFELWLPFLVANAMMIVGTITEGGHNPTDVAGGLATLSIPLAQRLQRLSILRRLRGRVRARSRPPVSRGASAPSEFAF